MFRVYGTARAYLLKVNAGSSSIKCFDRCLSSYPSTVLDKRFIDFQLYEVLHADTELFELFSQFNHVSRDVIDITTEVATKIATEKYLPHYQKSDANEPTWTKEGGVILIPEVGEAIESFRAAGFFSAHADFDSGGMQLPSLVTNIFSLAFSSSNVSTHGYAFLAIAAGNMLAAVGSEDQKRRYLAPMLEGRFTGTMNLSETQAGSSLGDIRTRAEKLSDGRYSIRGNKMWISGGDHRLSENIVHMVLAKVCAADGSVPVGVKGISLFVVPKNVEDGVGGWVSNDVTLVGLNHKMGYRGITNCVMSFGENGACRGELLGEEGKGLATMFLMMNEARIGVGLGAAALGFAGYKHSLVYARERRQGRTRGTASGTDQAPIIEHADVRRMLLAQKACVEGALSLCLFGSLLVDQLSANGSEGVVCSPQEVQEKEMLLDVLTPIIKAWPSEWCLEANKWAVQVLGGYGYTRDYPLEQLYRDNRLNMIHEGTNGIQSIDLLGRKVGADGRGMAVLARAMREGVERAVNTQHQTQALGDHAAALTEAVDELEDVTAALNACADPDVRLCNSHEFLNMAGHVVIAWRWLEMESAACRAVAETEPESSDRCFYNGIVLAADFFFRHELPKTGTQATLLRSLDDISLRMQDSFFT